MPADIQNPGEAPRSSTWRAFRVVWIVGVAGVALSLALAVWFGREARRLDEARFIELGNAIGVGLDHRIEAIEEMLRDLQRILNEQETPSLAAWDEFMNQVAPPWNYPGVLAIGYATNTAMPPTLLQLDPWMRSESPHRREEFYRLPAGLKGAKTWSVWTLDCYRDDLRPPDAYASEQATTNTSTRTVQQRRYRKPAAAVAQAASTFFLRPHDGRERVEADEPSDDSRLLSAIFRDDVKIAGRQPLVRRVDAQALPGATMLIPTYHPSRARFWHALAPDPDWPSEARWLRWNLNAGYVFACLDLAAVLREVQGPGELPVRVEIHSSTNRFAPEDWLNPDGQPMHAGDSARRPAFSFAYPWPMYGDKWLLFFHTTPLFEAQSTRYRAWWAGGWGLLTTALLGGLLTQQVRGRLRETGRAADLQEARDALQAVQRERERLSHDLHDGAIQSLYAVQLGLTHTADQVQAMAPRVAQQLSDSRAHLDGVIGELRQFITRLRSADEAPVPTGLAAVLASIVSRLRPATSANLELECNATASDCLPPEEAVQLANIAREALSNCLRHARARNILVRLTLDGTQLVLEVRDDGLGFAPQASTGPGLGLDSFRRRARLLGGQLDLETAPGRGTVVRVRLPVRSTATAPVTASPASSATPRDTQTGAALT